jgi:hypothetical protein
MTMHDSTKLLSFYELCLKISNTCIMLFNSSTIGTASSSSEESNRELLSTLEGSHRVQLFGIVSSLSCRSEFTEVTTDGFVTTLNTLVSSGLL